MTIPVLSHFSGCDPIWFWIRTWSPTVRGMSRFVCSDRRSQSLMWRWRSASSRAIMVSIQLLCGLYRPGGIGIKSRIGRPNMHLAGDNFVSLSGVFLYCNIARWNASVLRSPLGLVFPVIKRLTVLTPTSARQLLWRNATDDSLWWTPQSCSNFRIVMDVNSGPPSEASSSGIPNVPNVLLKQSTRPLVPPEAFSTIGHFEYRSTTTK